MIDWYSKKQIFQALVDAMEEHKFVPVIKKAFRRSFRYYLKKATLEEGK